VSERRFTDKPELNPEAVRGLPDGHPALVGNRTLFPNMVVEVTADEPDRLLVSGDNNRKIGATVEKGVFKGYAIYMLSLEERATCPEDCEVRSFCYGNGMHQARRHRIGDSDTFYDRLGLEIAELTERHEGVLIRLHVLGDFPSVEYVSFWKEALDEYPNLACFGYTHRSPKNWGGDEIGDAIEAVKDTHSERFRIRWSSPVSRADGAIVIDHVPVKPRTVNNEIVCPSQTDATACCATCALCWEKASAKECIAFIKHGPKSSEVEARGHMNEAAKAYWSDKASREPLKVAVMAPPLEPGHKDSPASLQAFEAAVESEPLLGKVDRSRTVEGIDPEPSNSGALVPVEAQEEITERRRIRAITIPGKVDLKVNIPAPPEPRTIDPSTLIVEVGYQRDLSGKSLRLIRNIVLNWDWAKFKPPVCAETREGLFVIDGQHTAIAAASHPGIKQIPVMVVQRPDIEDRAAAFVSQNRNRLTMSPLQVFHAELIAGDKTALGILRCVVKAGSSVPRNPPKKGEAKPGEIVSMSALRHVWAGGKAEHLERVLRIAVQSGVAPITTTILRGLDIILKDVEGMGFGPLTDEDLAQGLARIEDLEKASEENALEAGTSRYVSAASLIACYAEDWDAPAEAAQ
jgi:hypothetical protein